MDFRTSPLFSEVETITRVSENPVNFHYSVIIHTAEENIDPLKFVSYESEKDYEVNFSEEASIKVLMGLGKYTTKIFPNRNQLEITLIRKPVNESKDKTDEKNAVMSKRYIAILYEDISNPILESGSSAELTEETLDRTNIATVEFQLIDKALYQLKMVLVGGIYRSARPDEVIRGLILEKVKKLDLPAQYLPTNVDVRKASVEIKSTSIVIPQGTRLVDVPNYIQNKAGGVYTTGIGTFYDDGVWYTYPLYDTTQFKQQKETLTIINVPSNLMPGIERTYRYEAGNLTILCTGDLKFSDDSEKKDLTLGNGVRYSDANKFMEGFVSTKGNKASVNRAKNNTEIIATERKSGENYAPVSNIRATANKAIQLTALSARACSQLSLLWENANADLIYPAMPVRLMYLEDEEVKVVYGSVLKTQQLTQTRDGVFMSSKYYTNLALFVVINRGVTVKD